MTPRHAARVDGNHAELREAARRAGYTWFDTFRLGCGFPDALVISKTNIPVAVEIKDREGKLTDDEREFADQYSAPYALVTSVDELMAALERWDRIWYTQLPGYY